MGQFMIDILGYGTFALAGCYLTYWRNDRTIRAASRSAEIAEARAEMWEKRHTTEFALSNSRGHRIVVLSAEVTELRSRLHVSEHAAVRLAALTDELIVARAGLEALETRVSDAERARDAATEALSKFRRKPGDVCRKRAA